jgi:hypothetical protein
MRDKVKNIIQDAFKKLKEESSTGGGGASFSAGDGAQYASKYSFKKGTNEKGLKNPYYYKLGFKPVPDKIKGSGLEVKQLFEDEMLNEYSDFQNERIKAFETVENELNSLLPLLSNAKNDTAEFYAQNPGSFEVVTPTDLILDYLKDIKTLLKAEQ